MKLILIEDDALDEKAFLRAARSLEMTIEVNCYSSLEACLQDVDSVEVPDLFVTDMKLPGARGVELRNRLKGRGAVEMVPIVMISTSAAQEDIQSCYSSGLSGYFCKPIHSAEWRELLTTIFSYWQQAELTKPSGETI